jgi:hypothetical protein
MFVVPRQKTRPVTAQLFVSQFYQSKQAIARWLQPFNRKARAKTRCVIAQGLESGLAERVPGRFPVNLPVTAGCRLSTGPVVQIFHAAPDVSISGSQNEPVRSCLFATGTTLQPHRHSYSEKLSAFQHRGRTPRSPVHLVSRWSPYVADDVG